MDGAVIVAQHVSKSRPEMKKPTEGVLMSA